MRQLRHNCVNSISTYILETMHWSENESVYHLVICKKLSSKCSKSSSTSHDNPPSLQSIYLILDSLNIDTSNLKKDYVFVCYPFEEYGI